MFRDLPKGEWINTCCEKSWACAVCVCCFSWLMALAFSCHQFIWRLASVCWFPGGNKSHIHSLQSVLQLLLVNEGSAGVSSMTVRMQTLVCRASPLQHLLGMSQAQWPSAPMQPGLESPTRDQLSGEEHPACASWKRPKEGWPLVKQQALDLVKYIPSISYQRSHTQGVPLPHLFIKLARWVRRWKHLLACLTCEGVMPPCGGGSRVTFSSPEWSRIVYTRSSLSHASGWM